MPVEYTDPRQLEIDYIEACLHNDVNAMVELDEIETNCSWSHEYVPDSIKWEGIYVSRANNNISKYEIVLDIIGKDESCTIYQYNYLKHTC